MGALTASGEVAIVALVPGLVEVAKRAGLPARFAGPAAILLATVLAALVDLAGGGAEPAPARWLLAGVVYGLAASGLYSQGRALWAPGEGAVRGAATARPPREVP